jgi:predicted DsbA family dithiol-disulfide isomerase
MVELLFADQGRLDPPHLWQRAEALGLDVKRFDADMQSLAADERITGDFRAAVRAGVATTPTLLVKSVLEPGVPTFENLQDWAA